MENQKKYQVKFLPTNKTATFKYGYNLRQAILDSGIEIESSCGGVGTCGKCRVQIKEGKPEIKKSKFISEKEENEGFVLSCLTKITDDLVVFIPKQKKARAIIDKGKLAESSGVYAAVSKDEFETAEIDPWIKKAVIEMEKPSLSYGTSDLYRFKKAVKEKFEIKDCIIPIDVIRELPDKLRKENWKVTVTIDLNRKLVMNVEAGKSSEELYGVALDIGTTTIVMYLVDLEDGKIIGSNSEYNPQIRFGEDIINRIVYANKEGGLKKLNEVVVDSINNLVWRLLLNTHVEPDNIVSIVVSGNSTMMHLFYRVPPKYIREEPYVTVANRFSDCRARELGIKHVGNAFVFAVQGVASYLGGDITSGVLATGMGKKKDLALFIDLGTNGELVVGNSEWMMGCSCSAGPAFEGGGVKCGTRAVEGAIQKVWIDQETYKAEVGVIGGGKPRGICGSGLIDVIGEMYLKGVIDRKGKFNKNIGNEYLKCVEKDCLYILVDSKDSADGKEIYISEVDIDNLMRAKAAVYAGIKTLLEEVDLSVYDLDKVYLAGGLGKKLNIGNAVVIGMLPDINVNKYYFLGNTSITGAYLGLLSSKKYTETIEIADALTYVELSVNMKFMDRYVAGLFFPYTDLTDFPTVEELIFSLDNKNRSRKEK
ncbi:MAG: ASKHA domain-containing protein [Candidatus Humimicrobiaceae bacterium]